MRSYALRGGWALALACLFTSSLSAQGNCATVVNAPSAEAVGGSCNAIPFGLAPNISSGYSYMSRVPASMMEAGNRYVDDVSFALCGFGGGVGPGVWASNNVIIAMGHLPSVASAPFGFPTFDAAGVVQTIGDFLDLTIVHNSFATGTPGPASTTGTFTWNQIADTWSPMGFAASLGTGFQWDGANDVGFFITFDSAVVSGSTGFMYGDSLLRTYGAGFNLATASTNNATSALRMRLDVSQGPNQPSAPTWQCNNASAGLTVNGAPNPGPSNPIRTLVPSGTSVSADFSGLAGLPWDLAITVPQPGVGIGAGGLLTPGNQAVNINLAAPSLQFLFNAALANAFAAFSTPINSNTPLSLAAQSVVVDPAALDGFSLSALNEVTWETCNPNQDFEGLPIGFLTAAEAPIAWVSPSNGGSPWAVNTTNTSSAGTGPTAAFGGTNYLYCETSGQFNTTFSFDTCAADATQSSSLTLGFALSRIGATVGTLNIYTDDGTGIFSTLLATYAGADPGQVQNGVEWSNESITFTPISPQVSFRFEYVSGASFTGDLAIDELTIQ